jgi:CP family cyanate transporter-like MFS transporter
MTTGGGAQVAIRALAAIFIYAVALRPQLVSIGPLATDISADLGIPFASIGLLTTIPLACMGLAALVVAPVVGRLGGAFAMTLALVVIVAVGLVRAQAPEAAVILLLTVPIGVAIGLAGATLPVVVKERFAGRPATATGVYTTAIQLGSTLAAVLAVPLALAFGGWRGALTAFAVLGAVSLLAWVGLEGRPTLTLPRRRLSSEARPPGRWRDPVAWLLAVLFWLSAFPFYGLTSWLAAAYVERGWSELDAGMLVALVGLSGMPASLIIGYLGDRVAASRRVYLVGSSLILIVSTAGLVVLPDLAVLWAIVSGAMLGAVFTLALMLPVDLARSPARAAGLVAVTLSVGYLLTAATPWLLGAVRDATGSFTLSLWLIVAVAVALLVVSLPFSAARMERWHDRPD